MCIGIQIHFYVTFIFTFGEEEINVENIYICLVLKETFNWEVAEKCS